MDEVKYKSNCINYILHIIYTIKGAVLYICWDQNMELKCKLLAI